MSAPFFRAASFIVRIRWEYEDDKLLRWRGQVIHAQNRRRAYFENVPALVTFLERWGGKLTSEEEDHV